VAEAEDAGVAVEVTLGLTCKCDQCHDSGCVTMVPRCMVQLNA